MPSEDDRATAKGNKHKNLVKFGHAVFDLGVLTDKQTNRRTNKHTHYNTSYPSRGRSDKLKTGVRLQNHMTRAQNGDNSLLSPEAATV